ncbi:MAG: triose-phosphate isomerase [Patescibacteria group bacterium]|nr:triose-phosphate isomerase [Patescibacteria group bacterium]
MDKKLIVANWKMNPLTIEEAKELFEKARVYAEQIQRNDNLSEQAYNIKIVICPPFVCLSNIAGLINKTKIKLGAQDVFFQEEGGYTGEISPEMLKNLGVEYVIIGHSERRALGETDEIISKKVSESLKEGLKVILCAGESEREFRMEDEGLSKAEEFVLRQLEADLINLNFQPSILNTNLIVAYEPVWAIGTNHPDTPEDAVEMIKFIKQFLNSHYFISDPKVLYGGSVDSRNIKDFIVKKEIDGALVGHASIEKGEFEKILRSIHEYTN